MQEPEQQALEAAVERVLEDSPRCEPNGLIFDWEPLALSEPNLIIFSAEIHYQDERSRVRFGIDLSKLQEADQGRLLSILSARHAGIDNRQSLLVSLEWMLALSLEQTELQFTKDEREKRARQLLLLALALHKLNHQPLA